MKKMPNEHALSKKNIERAFWIASDLLLPYGGKLEESEHDYECFTFKTDSVSLVFYPHRTSSTGNYHIRVRDHGSKDKKKAGEIMAALYDPTGQRPGFSRKHYA